MASERGQATIEWIGLVLMAALVLGGLAASRPGREGSGLGEAVAARITCGARGGQKACAEARAAAPSLGAAAAAPAGRVRAPARAAPLSRARVADAFRRLRGASTVARRLWIVCLGYRRWRYELAHPRAPNEPLPLREALDIANTCLNPYGFVAED